MSQTLLLAIERRKGRSSPVGDSLFVLNEEFGNGKGAASRLLLYKNQRILRPNQKACINQPVTFLRV